VTFKASALNLEMSQKKMGIHARHALHALRPPPAGVEGIWGYCGACEFKVFEVRLVTNGTVDHHCRECNPELTAGAEALADLVAAALR
jgi:hypothetical protein